MAKGEFDLKRLEITAATRTWLEWKSRTTGLTAQEVVRKLLHEIALRETTDAKLLAALSGSDGASADSAGRAG
jgi:hypothetical protein